MVAYTKSANFSRLSLGSSLNPRLSEPITCSAPAKNCWDIPSMRCSCVFVSLSAEIPTSAAHLAKKSNVGKRTEACSLRYPISSTALARICRTALGSRAACIRLTFLASSPSRDKRTFSFAILTSLASWRAERFALRSASSSNSGGVNLPFCWSAPPFVSTLVNLVPSILSVMSTRSVNAVASPCLTPNRSRILSTNPEKPVPRLPCTLIKNFWNSGLDMP